MMDWASGLSERCLLCGVILLAVVAHRIDAGGCSYKAEDGGFPDSRVAACRGNWVGHVKFGIDLCAEGWDVCNWNVDSLVLSRMSWTEALSIDGCYAYNAAQDGGRCRECKSSLDQDDMAGVGRGCPHQNKGQTSCITGGRIDSSCCVDSHISLNMACRQQSYMTGVLCCKQSAKRPHIVVPPPERLDVNVGHIFMLSCQATGSPQPRVQWYKDGAKIATAKPYSNSRISVLESGDLLVTLSKRSDSGHYSCEVINEEGIDIAHTKVLVKEHDSGCEDGSTEGLSIHKDIHACAGRWKGHIKHGRTLCRPGWRVCSSDDEDRLKDLSWLDILDMKGCYAYNAANNKRGKCTRCRPGRGKLAGIGRNCGRIRYSRPSCISYGRIDVFQKRDEIPKQDSCSYSDSKTTGVLCCKRARKTSKPHGMSRPMKNHCSLGCENGGQCVGYNVCMCPVGYKGAMCQNAVCPDGCGSRAKCVSPGKCECIHPYTGKNCSEKKHSRCSNRCLNGGRCRRGRCKCPPTHYGSRCQHLSKHIFLSHLNRTER